MSLHKDSVRIQNSHVLLPATTQAWCFHKLNQKQQTKPCKKYQQIQLWCGVSKRGRRRPAQEAAELIGLAELICEPRGL